MAKEHHRQCQIAIATFASLDIKRVIAMTRKIIKAALYHQTGDKTHVAIKPVNEQDVLYVKGYCLKDWGREYFHLPARDPGRPVRNDELRQ